MGWLFPHVRIKEVVVLYVASLALMVLSQVSIPAQSMDLHRTDSVLTNYDDAYTRAGQEGKPILVLFTTQSQPSEIQDLRSKGLLNDFLVVVADRSTDAGRRIFSMFNMQSPEGVSVVEKTRQWQFARYDRKLNSDELARVAANSRNAAGFPAFDPLAGGVSAYPPPAQGQVAQPGQPAVARPASCRRRSGRSVPAGNAHAVFPAELPDDVGRRWLRGRQLWRRWSVAAAEAVVAAKRDSLSSNNAKGGSRGPPFGVYRPG